ncbi:MAG: ester cyclase [Acidimicrobiia bacterium]
MSEANKDVVRRYQEAYNTNKLDVLDEVLAPDWKTNAWPEGVPQSVEAAKGFYQEVLGSFPDVEYVTEQLVAEGEWVVQRMMFRGTFKGDLGELPANGRVVKTGGVSMFRVVDGKIVEHWAFVDEATFWHQCGVEVPEIMLGFAHRSQHADSAVAAD